MQDSPCLSEVRPKRRDQFTRQKVILDPQIGEPIATTEEVLQVVSVTYPCQGDRGKVLVYKIYRIEQGFTGSVRIR